MDDVFDWHELPRDQQLNVICDGLAKAAALKCINGHSPSSLPSQPQLLPLEGIAIFVNDVKQTSDPANSIRFACGKHDAQQFLLSEKGWSSSQFEEVDWENLHDSLQTKPDGFRTWLSKQHSDFCATRVQTNRWFGSGDIKCPSCLTVDERADHLCRCNDPARRQLMEEETSNLIRWMSIGENTHPDIIGWVETFILSQGNMALMHRHTTTDIRDLVESQQRIGWRNFMEGRISIHFHRLQFCHLIEEEY
jgi:hypothetical protein